jgi:flavin reductase (DIM6/NTAB) family NADH-FMN oxidoreductase RutF
VELLDTTLHPIKLAFLQSYFGHPEARVGLVGSNQAQRDELAFRSALSRFAAGVAVVTTNGKDGELIGFTISSFNSVSLNPPLVLFSIHRKALSLPAIQDAQAFGINLLRSDQEYVAAKFARAQSNKWAGVAYSFGTTGAPLLSRSLAHFECVPYANYDGGDHVIIVGEVVRFSAAETGSPLIFFKSNYCTVSEICHADEWPLAIHY